MTHNSIQGTPQGSEMVHRTIIQIRAEQEQWMELLELSNYRPAGDGSKCHKLSD